MIPFPLCSRPWAKIRQLVGAWCFELRYFLTISGLPFSSIAGGRMDSLAPTPPITTTNNGGRDALSMLNGWTHLLGHSNEESLSLSSSDTSRLTKCPLCNKTFKDPRVLACFHSFCKECLEKQLDNNERIVCPRCMSETQISASLGVDGLLSDYGLQNAVNAQVNEEKAPESRKSPSVEGEPQPVRNFQSVCPTKPGFRFVVARAEKRRHLIVWIVLRTSVFIVPMPTSLCIVLKVIESRSFRPSLLHKWPISSNAIVWSTALSLSVSFVWVAILL